MKILKRKIKFWPIAIFLLLLVFVFGFFLLRCEKENLPEFKILHKEPIIEEKQLELETTKKDALLSVPFVLQAPFANWDNPIFQDACEEAAILMAKYWLQEKEITKQESYNEILALAGWEEQNYGNFYDHSAEDTAQIMREYIGYQNIEARHDIDIEDIKTELGKGNLVVVPINGQAIGNPYYTQPGPERHMLVIIGWDEDTGEFITNDSGTRMGKDYRYLEDVLFWAIRDYATGHKVPIIGTKKAMIVIKPRENT